MNQSRRLGRAAVFAGVSAAHLGLFAWIGLRAPIPYFRVAEAPPPVEAFLVPPPPPPPRTAAADSTSSRAAAPYRPRLVLPVAPAEVAPLPAPSPGPEASQSGASTSPAPLPAPWDGVREALRGSGVGCGNRDRVGLTAAERASCDERAGAASALAKPLPLALEARKQARFDADAAEGRAWTAYRECVTGPECDAKYPGHAAAVRRLLGK